MGRSANVKRLMKQYPRDAGMVAGALIHEYRLNVSRIIKANKPKTGPFYWLPKPKGKSFGWQLMVFYDADYDGFVEHDSVWPECVEFLSIWWKKDPSVLQSKIRDNIHGVPRGRVVKMARGFGIAHGNDTPVDNGLQQVVRAYGLKEARYVLYFDEHERIVPGDPEEISTALSQDLGLVGVNPFEEESVSA